MNQILSVDNTKTSNTKKMTVKSIIMVFAIILLIFGIGLTSTGAYSCYRYNISKASEVGIPVSTNTKPSITMERTDASHIKIVVSHNVALASVTYTLNSGETTEIATEGKDEIEETVELPSGTSNIVVIAKDKNGVESEYENTFEVEEKPSISLEQVETNIEISVTSKSNIDYVLYYWDEDEENATKLTINATETKTLVEVKEGTHTLNIKAADINGKETTKTQKIIGDNKPELTLKKNGSQVTVTATDDEELSKIEITLNSNDTKTEEISGKEYTTTVNLEDGENKLKIVVYNKNGVSNVKKVKCTKE